MGANKCLQWRSNSMPLFGYARVSTRDQNLAARDAELMAAGCAKVFKEKVSGAKTDRPELAKVIGRLEPGDVLVVTVLGGLAEFDRELIRARTGEGRKRAKDRGVRFGRPRKMTPHQRQEALQRLAAGETYADVARTYNVDATTIGRLAAASPFGLSAVGQ